MRGARSEVGLLAFVLCAAAFLSLLPIGRLTWAAFVRRDGFAPDRAVAAILAPATLEALSNTLVTGIASAILALAIGAVAAAIVTLTDTRGRRAFAFLFVLSMMMAPQVVALAWVAASGPASPLLGALGLAPPPGTPNPIRGPLGIVLVLAIHHAPLAFVTVRAGLSRIDRDLVEAAEIDGADRRTVLFRVLVPLARGHIAAAGALCFVAAIGNFGIPALLGISADYMTLPTLIWRRMTSLGPAGLADSAATSLWLVGLSALGVMIGPFLRGREARIEGQGRGIEGLWPTGRAAPLLRAVLGLILFVALVLPLVSLLAAAFVPAVGVRLTPATATLDAFVEVLIRQDATTRAFRNSLLYSAVAGLACAAAALPIAYALARRWPGHRGWITGILELPYALPGVVLAVGTILIFLRPLPLLGITLYGTAFVILFAYLARFLPLALGPTLASLSQLDPRAEEAAELCGAGRMAILRHIVGPAAAPAMVAGGLMVFLVAFNELTVSALLWARGTETIGVVMFGLEEAGLGAQAAALALTATAVVAIVMALLDRLGDRLPEGTLPWR